ncbi:MAG: hypothetical protein ABSC63_10635 [Candidatus Binataceae bacterium]|jgi:hypothetical protein
MSAQIFLSIAVSSTRDAAIAGNWDNAGLFVSAARRIRITRPLSTPAVVPAAGSNSNTGETNRYSFPLSAAPPRGVHSTRPWIAPATMRNSRIHPAAGAGNPCGAARSVAWSKSIGRPPASNSRLN